MKPDNKDKTVTFDFKGNLLHVKKPKILQDADQIVVQPDVSISTSSRIIRRNLQQFNRRPSEDEESLMMVEQIQENLDQLYEEGEKKLLAVRSSIQSQGSVGSAATSAEPLGSRRPTGSNRLQMGSSNRSLRKSVKIEDQVECAEPANEPYKTQTSERSSAKKLERSYLPGKSAIKKKTRELITMLGVVKDKLPDVTENSDYKPSEYLRGEDGKIISLVASNMKESGSAHVKHENRLFMKDPINTMKQKDVSAGLTLKTYTNSVLSKGPAYASISKKLSLTQYEAMKQQSGRKFNLKKGS